MSKLLRKSALEGVPIAEEAGLLPSLICLTAVIFIWVEGEECHGDVESGMVSSGGKGGWPSGSSWSINSRGMAEDGGGGGMSAGGPSPGADEGRSSASS